MNARLERGCVHVYTGEGKGKTTAAVGLAVRAAGAGLRVFFGQFAKGRAGGEVDALRRFEDLVTVRQFGRAGFIRGRPTPEDVSLAEGGLAEAEQAIESGYSVVILDEVVVAAGIGLVSVEQLLDLIAGRPAGVELVLTGRGADPRLIERADLVTEMLERKHYFRRGFAARRGIEY